MVELDAVDHAEAADLVDRLGMVLLDDLVHLIAEILAHDAGVLDDALVDHDVERGGSQSAGERTAGEGGAVGAGAPNYLCRDSK